MAQPPLVAIACQGGGSHAAFTAGVLAELLSPAHRHRYRLLGLSGTSGGAVCATLAWSGLFAAGPDEAIRRLRGFWHDLAASTPIEAWLNAWTQIVLSLPISVQASPYAYSPAAEPRLRELLERYVTGLPVSRMNAPWLRLGVADVLRGGGASLDGESDEFSISDVVASAAVPPLFRAVATRGGLWWDGLYAHNPPIGALLDLPDKPDELWIVRLNPKARKEEPKTAEAIEDRRNEMAGNLPLDQELDTIDRINRILEMAPGLAPMMDKRKLTVRVVEMPDLDLPYYTKLDRSLSFIEALQRAGEAAATGFFHDGSIWRGR
ncbi:patatin-like phospholipase family protein [Falsiroseomonas sp. HW251]|uniref:patatin-like phospholipase family protein n=1 Tax=Falsiroseomonas sp. HW251 TaxID=3390998 RepID=UPI003D31B831